MSTVQLSPETAWKAALGELEMQMTRATFTTWLQGTRALSGADGEFEAHKGVSVTRQRKITAQKRDVK